MKKKTKHHPRPDSTSTFFNLFFKLKIYLKWVQVCSILTYIFIWQQLSISHAQLKQESWLKVKNGVYRNMCVLGIFCNGKTNLSSSEKLGFLSCWIVKNRFTRFQTLKNVYDDTPNHKIRPYLHE